MSKLTKEECLNALDYLFDNALDNDYISVLDSKMYDILEQLINEHFDNPLLEYEKQFKRIQELELKEKQWIETEKDYRDELKELKSNPPLTFEELKEGMWVWDSNWNEYFEISDIYHKTKEIHILIHQNRINQKRYEPIKFEENRYFRKQIT